MKRLSARQAARCEEAKAPRCRCRCGGVFHGSMRDRAVDVVFWDDPHVKAFYSDRELDAGVAPTLTGLKQLRLDSPDCPRMQ